MSDEFDMLRAGDVLRSGIAEWLEALPLDGGIAGRESVADTPGRYVRALEEMTAGYRQDPEEILSAVFEDPCDEMVVLRGAQYWSLCEHHLLPFFGTVTVGYLPTGKVVGLSKLARVVHCFSRRLQMQERMTRQIGRAILKSLRPSGVGVLVKGRHLCMEVRGAQTRAETVTSYLGGTLRSDDGARAEFLELARNG